MFRDYDNEVMFSEDGGGLGLYVWFNLKVCMAMTTWFGCFKTGSGGWGLGMC